MLKQLFSFRSIRMTPPMFLSSFSTFALHTAFEIPPDQTMNFFDLPIDIRLGIYSELLVLSGPIVFVADSALRHRPSFWPKGMDSVQLFSVPIRGCTTKPAHYSIPITAFSSLKYPRIVPTSLHPSPNRMPNKLYSPYLYSLPTFDYSEIDTAGLNMAHIKNLELIRDTCTSMRILELLVSQDYTNYALSHSPVAAGVLHLLDTCLKNIPSLKEIIIDFEVYPEDGPSNDLTEKMHGYGWTASVTKLPKKNGSLWTIELNLTMKKIVWHMTMSSSSLRSGRARSNFPSE